MSGITPAPTSIVIPAEAGTHFSVRVEARWVPGQARDDNRVCGTISNHILGVIPAEAGIRHARSDGSCLLLTHPPAVIPTEVGSQYSPALGCLR